nr:hypothetical protein [uncultured Oscillibacter sp.]
MAETSQMLYRFQYKRLSRKAPWQKQQKPGNPVEMPLAPGGKEGYTNTGNPPGGNIP